MAPLNPTHGTNSSSRFASNGRRQAEALHPSRIARRLIDGTYLSSYLPNPIQPACPPCDPKPPLPSKHTLLGPLGLPAEILLHIFDYVDSAYFRKDLSRLTICKQWYKYASTMCFRDFQATQSTVQCLFSSPYLERSLARLRGTGKTLDLNLTGYDHRHPHSYGREVRAACRAWTLQLNEYLRHFAAGIRESRNLRVLRIQATSKVDPMHPRLGGRPYGLDYLVPSTVRAFLLIENLTSLELDLCGSRFVPGPGRTNGTNVSCHICTDIAALLTTLRRLRLRMRTICADFLKPPPVHNAKLRLNEVIINLSLYEALSRATAQHAVWCRDSSTPEWNGFEGGMEAQARILAARMATPREVRIIRHTLPDLQMHVRCFK
ncbi:hypothetical protein M011DRAFT_72326 [Sporormia fimetaria CBS 119925]|uniref:Uncharacterized protein n=1 Tax=Sporormia fimetaria CBS 119925 TaxID=1340428 RepID=A0A6A6VBM7_9PLEO|nr:hypothetical protein M011DRAFT_72326 [Sporormia fimetaria CBS 119925]